MPLHRILLPLDFSEYASDATHYACSMADAFRAELHLLHVLEIRHSLTPVFGGGLSLTTVSKESRLAAEQALRSNIDPDWVPPADVKYATADGPPFVEIIKYAQENDIDMIVMSTHGRSGVAHMLLGSVAENVIRSAPCPVLTVQSKRHKFVKL
ncbi:MAG: universal stress protein [Planctomycetota bacterium]|nr:universal stress protein [Planctomycetota bacterium]